MFLFDILSMVGQVLFAPFKYTDMLWVVIPLFVSLTLIELYFGRYTSEELGWNSALSNSMLLAFVGLNLFQRIFDKNKPWFSFPWSKFFVASLLFVIGLVFLYMNFYHKLPKRLAFTLFSVLPVNMIAYFAVVLVYTSIPFNLITFISWLILLGMLWGFFQIIHHFEQKVRDAF
ncbi:MAG: hypothetical protein KKF44_03265 [Nanoarchaeota archaeon]|nr:hypothetical protein [Nanoarchaeota archaeon]